MRLQSPYVTAAVNCRQVCLEAGLFSVFFSTNVALKGFDVTDGVNFKQVQFKAAFLSESVRTDTTLKSLDVTKTVNCR